MPNAMVHPALADADEMDLVDSILARFEDEEDEWGGGDGDEGWEDEDDLDAPAPLVGRAEVLAAAGERRAGSG